MGELFGTDGIRGIANKHPITAEIAVGLGRAVASCFSTQKTNTAFVIGKDTRISGDMLENAVAAGICSMGADVYSAGVIPTPAIAALVPGIGADAGIVISASHNPYQDNGIKIIGKDGFKLPDEKENAIEKILFAGNASSLSENVEKTGRVQKVENAEKFYTEFLLKSLPDNFSIEGMKIVLDCSNGAAFRVAPEIFSRLKAEVKTISNEPDGLNINENCGSQHTETLRRVVVETGADIGLAFDGDADRLVCVDEKGNEIRGDKIMFVCAKHLKEKGKLKNDLLVTTVMSNIGLKLALEKLGIKHAAAKVGDRYVMETMRKKGACLGGEDSGHIIFLDHHTTGDGIMAALKLLEAMQYENKALSELADTMAVFPQVLVNVPVKAKPAIETLPDAMRQIEAVEKQLGARGRVLVRYSGTQLKCRVMVEGPTMEETETLCGKIADAIKDSIGT